MKNRCEWVKNLILEEYHDSEWGVLSYDDRHHFEHICLSGFQAGLSWEIILRKREHLRCLFSGFNPEKIMKFANKDVKRILADERGIRNKKKIVSVINNAKAFQKIKTKQKSFSRYVFELLGNKVIVHRYHSWSRIPSYSKESILISEKLKKQGFSFLGPTIAYAYLQAIGFIDDHISTCFWGRSILKDGKNSLLSTKRKQKIEIPGADPGQKMVSPKLA